LLADAAKGPLVWKAIARQMGLQALRMNLNTLMRHDVFADKSMIDEVASRLVNADEIKRSKQFPYQYFAAYLNADPAIPQKIKSALHDAAEIACGNVPELPGPVVIGLDTSGSMNSPATGYRRGARSKMRCVDVAALFAAAILRRNPDSVVIPFDTKAYKVKVDPGDTILSLSSQLSKYGGGGTNCSLPIAEANRGQLSKRPFAGIILVSDNESWVGRGRRSATGVLTHWNQFAKRQRKLFVGTGVDPKLVCIDIQPYGNTQAPDRKDILNVGGFSDAVFKVVSDFMSNDESRFVTEIESIEL
jgi:60 kDa SS-A/Ro ribonucleoprotein